MSSVTTPSTPPAPSEEISAAVDAAVATVRRNIAAFGAAYPDDTTRAGRYPLRPSDGGFAEGANRGWTTSFWAGMQWLAWELTGEEEFRRAALAPMGEDGAEHHGAEQDGTPAGKRLHRRQGEVGKGRNHVEVPHRRATARFVRPARHAPTPSSSFHACRA